MLAAGSAPIRWRAQQHCPENFAGNEKLTAERMKIRENALLILEILRAPPAAEAKRFVRAASSSSIFRRVEGRLPGNRVSRPRRLPPHLLVDGQILLRRVITSIGPKIEAVQKSTRLSD